MFLLVNN